MLLPTDTPSSGFLTHNQNINCKLCRALMGPKLTFSGASLTAPWWGILPSAHNHAAEQSSWNKGITSVAEKPMLSSRAREVSETCSFRHLAWLWCSSLMASSLRPSKWATTPSSNSRRTYLNRIASETLDSCVTLCRRTSRAFEIERKGQGPPHAITVRSPQTEYHQGESVL